MPYYSTTDGLLVGGAYIAEPAVEAGVCERKYYDPGTGCVDDPATCPTADSNLQFHACNPCRYWTLMKFPNRARGCGPSNPSACEETIWRIGDRRTTGGEPTVCDLDCHFKPNRVVGWLTASMGTVRLGSSSDAPAAFLLADHHGSSCDKPSHLRQRDGRAVIYAWSTDGLWVADLFHDRDDMSERGAWKYALTGDNTAVAIHQDPHTRDVLLFGGSVGQVKVYRITGWSDVISDSGEVRECAACPGP